MLKDDDNKGIGSMMPKSFGVYEKSDGKVYVSTINGAAMSKIFGGDAGTMMEKRRCTKLPGPLHRMRIPRW